MNCPMFAYVLGRFILRFYTNYIYNKYKYYGKLMPTANIITRILKIYYDIVLYVM